MSDRPDSSAPDDGRTFANLMEARDALWRGVNDLEAALDEVRGDLSAVEGLALGILEQHGASLGPTADGLHHCASRALDALAGLRELHRRLDEAAFVVRENDSSRLSAAALRARYEPGPHRENY